MDQTGSVVGRLAPSPSGQMHLGNAFSALLAWLAVRSRGGTLVLRMEDLDPDRCRRSYCDQVEEDLRWLGLDWDAGGRAGGDAWFQSCRREIYEQYLAQLDQLGLLYPCFCTRSQLHAASAPHVSDGQTVYPGTCRDLTPEEREHRSQVRQGALRIRVPSEEIVFLDGLQGEVRENLAADCGDFIVRRSDGVHAYQLAVVVDDALMGITQVVRGRDLLHSTPRQIWLQRQLGFAAPEYFHVPLLLAGDGRRLSKRERDLSLAQLKASGIAPEAVIGKLAYLAGLLDREEPISAGDLVSCFRPERLRRTDITVP